ncbi:MAG TPA: TlpA family protein disulfide reductase [Thiotrichales bacterium]|nr:TlpA family protein disulfide reductase [Thiotrichales bacterium]
MKRFLLLVLCLLALPVVAEPLDFRLPGLDGREHALADYRGKWVVLNFWATWCPPCLEEIPELSAFHEAHEDKDAVVLGLNYEDISPPQLKAFAEEYFISYPILLNGDLKPPHPRLMVPGLPVTYIVSPEGELVARQVGTVTAEALEQFLARQRAGKDKGR